MTRVFLNGVPFVLSFQRDPIASARTGTRPGRRGARGCTQCTQLVGSVLHQLVGCAAAYKTSSTNYNIEQIKSLWGVKAVVPFFGLVAWKGPSPWREKRCGIFVASTRLECKGDAASSLLTQRPRKV